MRSRIAVLTVAVALSAIAAAPLAKASTQTVITQDIAISGGHASFPLDSLSFIDIAVPQAAVVRIVRADSAGHQLLVVMVKPAPNPAGYRSARSTRAYLSNSRLAFNDARSSDYAERSQSLAFRSSLATSDRHYNQRVTPALRGTALIGTLVRGRLTRL